MTARESPGPVPIEALLAHREWVRALARSMHADSNDADDVEQETWRSALENPPRHAGSLRAWFASAVRHRAASAGRKSRVRTAREAEAVPRHDAPSPDDSVAAAELQTRIARAVLDLDEPYRTTVVLRYFDGMQASEIAARLSVPVETVRTRLKRAIERLRGEMGVARGDDRVAWCVLLAGRGEAEGIPSGAGAGGGAIAGAAAAAASVGGVVMATAATKVAVVAAVVLAGGVWWFVEDGAKPRAATDEADVAAGAPADDAEGPPGRRRAARDGTPAEVVAVAAPGGATTAGPAAKADAPPEGDVVHGRVIDADTGAPVAGAEVSLAYLYSGLAAEEPSTKAVSDGTFRIVGTNLARYEGLLLRSDGYADCVVGPWRDPNVKLEKGDAGDVRIHRGKRISGRVVASDGVSPISDAKLRLTTTGGSSSSMWLNDSTERGASDGRGEFTLSRIPPSHFYAYTLFAVSKEGVGWKKLPGDAGRMDADGVQIALRAGGGAVVSFRDESGAPIAGLAVVASPRFDPLGPDADWDVGHGVHVTESLRSSVFCAETDAQGVARFAALPTLERNSTYDFVVSVRATGAMAWTRATIRAGETAAVEVVAAPPRVRTLSGVVRRVDGSPVAGAVVRAADFPGAPVTTGADGAYRFSGAVATWGQRTWIAVSADGLAPAERSIKPDPQKETLTTDFTLKPRGPIAGRVVDQDGRPVAGAVVRMPRDDASINGRSATSDAEGRFAFPDTSQGAWSLTATPPPPQDEWEFVLPVVVQGGDANAVLVHRRAVEGRARLVLTVVDEAGAPLAPDVLTFERDDESTTRPYALHGKVELGTGRVVVERVKPGRHDVWLQFPDRLGTHVRVDVPDRETEIALRVEVGRAGKIRGRVDLADSGAQMPGHVYPDRADGTTLPDSGRPRDRELIFGTAVAADGTFEFPRLIPGRWRVFTRTGDHVGEAWLDVPSGGDAACVLRLVKRATVSIRLTAAPPSEIVEYWFGREGGRLRRVSGNPVPPGTVPKLEIPLEPGRWRWRVSFPAAGSWGLVDLVAETQEGEIVVEPGETKQIDVRVVPR